MEDSERKLFIDVVDLGSLSKAAAKHFVTPQSVSQHIRKLEGELGFPLLVRTAQGVSPTEAGCLFYEGCKDIDERLERLLSQCREEAGIMRATLRPHIRSRSSRNSSPNTCAATPTRKSSMSMWTRIPSKACSWGTTT